MRCAAFRCIIIPIYCVPFQPRMPRRQITPVNSPQKEKYGDRFIPSRAGNNWQVNFNMIQVSLSVFVCIFIILIGPFNIIFNIVSDIRGWDKTFPALADADI